MGFQTIFFMEGDSFIDYWKLSNFYIELKVKLANIVEGDQKGPF